MKQIRYFFLENCPYCKQASDFLEELIQENCKYKFLDIEYINESKNFDIVKDYNYYFVPCFYLDDIKVIEGVTTKQEIQNILELALDIQE